MSTSDSQGLEMSDSDSAYKKPGKPVDPFDSFVRDIELLSSLEKDDKN